MRRAEISVRDVEDAFHTIVLIFCPEGGGFTFKSDGVDEASGRCVSL